MDEENKYWLDVVYSIDNEVELIEPECIYNVGKILEPTDNNTEKIEEIDADSCGVTNEYNSQGEVCARGFNMGVFKKEIVDKLNEVIRYINRRAENE